MLEKVPQIFENLVRDSENGSCWVPPQELFPVSTQSRGRGHEGFAYDMRLIWNNCITYYGDNHPLAITAENLSNIFETLYSDYIISEKVAKENESIVNNTIGASVTDNLKAQLKSFISTNGSSLPCDSELNGDCIRISKINKCHSYQELSVDARLQLLSWLCSEFMNTNQFKTYLESTIEKQFNLEKEKKVGTASKGAKDAENVDAEEMESTANVNKIRNASKNVITPYSKGKRVASTDTLNSMAVSEDDRKTTVSTNSFKTPQSKIKPSISSNNMTTTVTTASSVVDNKKSPSKLQDEEIGSVVLRHIPIGSDRYKNQYYTFHDDLIRPQIYCELSAVSKQHLLAHSVTKGTGSKGKTASTKVHGDSQWIVYNSIDDINSLMQWLKDRGSRELQLKTALNSWLSTNLITLPLPAPAHVEVIPEEVSYSGTTTGRKRKSILPTYNEEENMGEENAPKRTRAVKEPVVEVDVAALEARNKLIEDHEKKRSIIVEHHCKDFSDYWKNEKPNYHSITLTSPYYRWIEVTLPESMQLGKNVF